MDFNKLKVVELAGVLAGPSVGMFFAELGAEVIKIENERSGGDVTRSWKLASEDKSSKVSAYFCSVNYHKEYQFKNLKEQRDLDKVRDLIREADIVLVNFKKGDDVKLGLDYETLKKINPKIIYAAITGFGDESERIAYDLILQAESGFMSMNGQESNPPTKMPVALIDVLAGHQLKEAILIELLKQGENRKAVKLTVSLFDSALASLVNQASNYLMTGHVPKRIGSKHPNIAPYGEIFETQDGKLITFAIGSHTHFQKLCEYLGIGELANDHRFSFNQNRVANRLELFELLQNEISKKDSKIVDELNQVGVPSARIKSLDEVFQSEEAQNLVLEENIDGVATKRVKSIVYKSYD
ncbi:MAG: CoA transferase [Crocinitomicaceae bacterium]|nr:CoA transferase [Crocinitomicaceae bacterium]